MENSTQFRKNGKRATQDRLSFFSFSFCDGFGEKSSITLKTSSFAVTFLSKRHYSPIRFSRSRRPYRRSNRNRNRRRPLPKKETKETPPTNIKPTTTVIQGGPSPVPLPPNPYLLPFPMQDLPHQPIFFLLPPPPPYPRQRPPQPPAPLPLEEKIPIEAFQAYSCIAQERQRKCMDDELKKKSLQKCDVEAMPAWFQNLRFVYPSNPSPSGPPLHSYRLKFIEDGHLATAGQPLSGHIRGEFFPEMNQVYVAYEKEHHDEEARMMLRFSKWEAGKNISRAWYLKVSTQEQVENILLLGLGYMKELSELVGKCSLFWSVALSCKTFHASGDYAHFFGSSSTLLDVTQSRCQASFCWNNAVTESFHPLQIKKLSC